VPWGKAIFNCLQEEFSNIGGDSRVPGRVEVDDFSFVCFSAVGGLVVGRLWFLVKEKTVPTSCRDFWYAGLALLKTSSLEDMFESLLLISLGICLSTQQPSIPQSAYRTFVQV